MGSHIGYDRALALLAEDDGTKHAIRANDEGYAIVTIEGVVAAGINAITFDALERNRQIKAAPEYDTDIGRIFVHRAFDPAVRAAHQMNGSGTAPDHDETAGLTFAERLDAEYLDPRGARDYDAAHAAINLAATLAADAAFAAIADDTIPYVETVGVQIAIAQIARAAGVDRRDMDDYAMALYRLIDRTPESEAPNSKIVAAYQRYNAASTALFDARAALLALLINPDMENTAPFVGASKIGR